MNEVIKESGYFDSYDGTPVYYESRGEGEPMVFCYGIVCTSNHFRHQIQYFSKKYRVITFDYRGHHKTPAPKDRSQLSIDGICRDIQGLCNHLRLDKAHFVGHSWGVQVLVRAYDMFPDLFKSLVFINGFASNPLVAVFGPNGNSVAFSLIKTVYAKLPATSDYVWKFLADNSLTGHISALAGGFNINLTSFKDIEIYGRGVANIELDVVIQLFDQMMRYDGRPVLDRITCPTLIISGTQDRVTPKSYQKDMHTRINASEFLTVPYGTHCSQLDMPELVNMGIERFVTSHYPQR
ncbi:MAG: alpha/beta hydrolase [Bdellovibrionales bacterium]|nr:alpha/beta hydrolase [Bdellovibrionales bacterium]